MQPLAEAIDRLQSAYAHEDYSALTGAPVFAVDCMTDPGRPSAAALATTVARLAELPCPSVALAGGASAAGARDLLAAFDVVVTSAGDLDAVLGAITRTPLAAAALVQLLRLGGALTTAEALRAESLTYSVLQSGPEFAAWLRSRPARAVPAPTSEPAVVVERHAQRLDLTLNRPERRNAFSAAMRDTLAAALHLAAADPEITEIVLTGRGPAFCSGGDLAEFGTLADPATAHAIRTTRNPARLLATVAERVRVVVHGACVGAGIELAAFAARVAAAPDSFFQLPEITMGLVPGAGGTVSLPQRIGRQRTAYLALTGVRLDVSTARTWGLVDDVVAR